MNHHTSGIRGLLVASIVSGAATVLPAQNTKQDQSYRESQRPGAQSQQAGTAQAGSSQAPDSQLRIVLGEMPNGLEKLAGKQVRSTPDAKDVGEIKDFVINPQSGRVEFVVVSSGGFAGVGEKQRFAPLQALRQLGEDQNFATELKQADWEALPIVENRDLDEGRIQLNDEQRRKLAQIVQQAAGRTSGREAASFSATNVIRASSIRGKEVRAGDQEVGEIEDVVIDLDTGSARAFLDGESEFTGSELYFLVPFNKLQLGRGQQDVITTALTRDDFRNAAQAEKRPAANTGVTPPESALVKTESRSADPHIRSRSTDLATNTDAATDSEQQRLTRQSTEQSQDLASVQQTSEQPPSPTGRMDQPSIDPVLQSAARAIRQAWDANPELAKLNLRVSPQNGRLVFQGSVPSQELRQRAKSTAEQVLSRIQVDHQISVQGQQQQNQPAQ